MSKEGDVNISFNNNCIICELWNSIINISNINHVSTETLTILTQSEMANYRLQGWIQEGVHPAPPPPPNWKKYMIILRKIVIFNMKYPKKFRASLRAIILSAPP